MAYVPNSGSVVSFQSDPNNLQASVTGTVTVRNPQSSVLVGNFPTTQNVSGSVIAQLSSSNASVITVGSPVANQSVSGTVGASVLGHAPVVIVGGSIATSSTPNQSVSGTVNVGNFPTSQNVSGSVVAFQGTPEWTVKSSIAGGIFPVSGSVAATITNTNINVSGSVVAFGFPTNQNVSGSVAAWLQSTNASVITVGTAAPNQSVSGTVGASIIGHAPVVIVGGSVAVGGVANQSVSGTVGASIIGTVPTTQSGTRITSLVGAYPNASTHSSSNLGVFQLGVVNANFATLADEGDYGPIQIDQFGRQFVYVDTIVPGTGATNLGKAEDAGHTTGDTGVQMLAVRNDQVASLSSANLDYTPNAVDSAGRAVIKPFSPEESTFRYSGSVVSTSVTLIAGSTIGKRNYVTDFWLSNTGASTTRIDFRDGSTSIIGHTIAPAGGGNTSPGLSIPLRTAPSQDLAFQVITATSVLYMTVTGYTAP